MAKVTRYKKSPASGEANEGSIAISDHHLEVDEAFALPAHTAFDVPNYAKKFRYMHISRESGDVVVYGLVDVPYVLAAQFDGILSNNAFSWNVPMQSGITGYSYRLNGVKYTNPDPEYFYFNNATSGKKRVDMIVVGTDPLTPEKVEGVEGDDFVVPATPDGKLVLAYAYISGSTMEPLHSVIEPDFAKIAGDPNTNGQLNKFLSTLPFLKKNTGDDGDPTPVSLWLRERGSGDPFFIRQDSDDNYPADGKERMEFSMGKITKYRRESGSTITSFFQVAITSVLEASIFNIFLDISSTGGLKPSLSMEPSASRFKQKIMSFVNESDDMNFRGDSQVDLRGLVYVNTLAASDLPEYLNNGYADEGGLAVEKVYNNRGYLMIAQDESAPLSDVSRIKTIIIEADSDHFADTDFRFCEMEMLCVNGVFTQKSGITFEPFFGRVTLDVFIGDEITFFYRA